MQARSLAVVAVIGVVLSLLAMYASMRAGWWNTDPVSMIQKYAGPPSKFATVDGARLHYRDDGSGPALVLLHGSGASLHEWDLVATRLKTHHRIVRLDWPPFGLSVDDGHGYSSARAADLVAGLVDQLGLSRFVLVSTSNGGNVAILYAAQHPEHVAALAFSVLPLVRPAPTRPATLRVRFMTWFFGNYLPNYHSKWFYRVIFEETTAPSFTITSQELTTVYELNNLPGAADHLAQYLSSNRQMFAANAFVAAASAISVPVLLQWCDLDTVIAPPSKGEEVKAAFKNAPVILLHYADIGHFPEFENPARFVQDLESFLVSLPIVS